MQKLTKQQELLNNYTNLDLERLPECLEKNGYTYRQRRRMLDRYIYEQLDGDMVVAYEVFKNKIVPHRARMVGLKARLGLVVNPNDYAEYKEAFPCDEDFGKRAWTYKTLAEAERKCEALT